MSTYYRIQSIGHTTNWLLDSESWISEDWGGQGEARYGISTCDSIEALGHYFSLHGGDLSDAVMVTLEAGLADDLDVDHLDGATLVWPTAIVSVTEPPEEFWNALFADAA